VAFPSIPSSCDVERMITSELVAFALPVGSSS
jgi:hypothetical protein